MSKHRDVPFGRPWITDGDREAVMRVLHGHVLTHGPECKAFEQEFAAFLRPSGDEGAFCVTVSSCMAALHLAYLNLGIGPGDEVIVPALTHVATVHAVEWVGARPVWVDCDPATGNVTAEAIERAVTPRTKALSVVHFVGIPCDMPAIMSVAQRHGLRVIEDCALAVGTRCAGKHVGLYGDVGCFSFYPVKHITTGEGGMLVTRHRDWQDRIAKLRAFGVERGQGSGAIPGTYEVPSLGLNFRMSEMAAALGRSQMRRIEENLGARADNFRALSAALTAIPGVRALDAQSAEVASSHYCLVAVLEGDLASRRDAIVRRLATAGVGTSVYYPQPVPRMRYYREKYGYDAGRFPEAEKISDGSVALPVGRHLEPGDVEHMAQALRAAIREEAK